MNILFDSEEERGARFILDEWCSYCGESLPMITAENREWVGEGFCTKICMEIFYAEDNLTDEPDYFDLDREELESLIQEEMKIKGGRLPFFKGEKS